MKPYDNSKKSSNCGSQVIAEQMSLQMQIQYNESPFIFSTVTCFSAKGERKSRSTLSTKDQLDLLSSQTDSL